MNVAKAPEHCGLEPEVCAILTDGVTVEFMVIVIPFDVAVKGLTQGEFEVNTQETICPFVSAELVKTELFVPAFTPFTFH